VAAYRQHLQTRGHQKREEKLKSGSAAAVAGLGLGEEGATEKPAKKKEGESGEAEEEEKEPGEEGEGDDDEIIEDKDHYAIPLGTCLFCKQVYPKEQLERCLEHMYKQHGFFIPFPEYCTDVEGLLTYLGEKIGLGCICLYCNGKSYPSIHAVQAHMEAKAHCKLKFETEEEEEELLDFYTFPGAAEGDEDEEEAEEETEEEEKKASKKQRSEAKEEEREPAGDESSAGKSKALIPATAAPRRRHLAGLNDAGELVMSDGSIIGHRSLAHVYRQNVKPVETTALSSQIMASYRALVAEGQQDKARHDDMPKRLQKLVERQRLRIRKERQGKFVKQFWDYRSLLM